MIGAVFCMHMYFDYIEKEAHRISMGTDDTFIADYKKENSQGMYVLNLEEDLKKYLSDKKNLNSVTYQVSNQSFYFDVNINKDGMYIKKLVDTNHHINARMDYPRVISIEYRVINATKSILLKFITKDDYKYLAIADDTYYFLGPDIDEVVYKDDQFYYFTYNTKYEALRDATKCNDKVKNMIEGFDYKDYYYRTGKINFMRDFYQKINHKYYYVKDHCNALKNAK